MNVSESRRGRGEYIFQSQVKKLPVPSSEPLSNRDVVDDMDDCTAVDVVESGCGDEISRQSTAALCPFNLLVVMAMLFILNTELILLASR